MGKPSVLSGHTIVIFSFFCLNCLSLDGVTLESVVLNSGSSVVIGASDVVLNSGSSVVIRASDVVLKIGSSVVTRAAVVVSTAGSSVVDTSGLEVVGITQSTSLG